MFHSLDAAKASIEGLTKHGIVKDVFKSTSFKPAGVLSAEYPNHQAVAMGNTLSVSGTQDKPTVQFTPMEGYGPFSTSDLLTLVLTDPDAPSRTDKKWSEYCHYIESDIKMGEGGLLGGGKVLQPYVGPGPPKGTGPHRYVFLLYQQPSGVTCSSFTPIKDRPNWGYGSPATGVDKWATENKLKLVGANFFLAENK
ncbi:related to Carboxypeptidase Y inhibitor [Zygosaccharomyces bailii ISA1307]|nr:related to Carboxypeptidase Y inhibitor [Zygosaccharomyces bailii ISA1307]